MILPEFKAVFVHVPKAAGQSIENFLLDELGKTRGPQGAPYLLRPNQDPDKGPKRLAHLLAGDYVKYNYMTQEQYQDWFSFSVVRNPWSRVVSFYKFRGFSSLVSFTTFVKDYLPLYFKNEFWFFRNQADFIYNDQDELLVDYLGKMEQLDSDFAYIANSLDIPFKKLPRSNTSEAKGLFSKKSARLLLKYPSILFKMSLNNEINKDYHYMYTPETLAIVNDLYARDVALLGYSY